MAELLIKAIEPSPFRDGAYRKGDVVEVRADGSSYGAKETLPLFVVVKVPGILMSTLRQYAVSWEHDIQFEVISSDLTADSHRIRLYAANSSVSGVGNVTQDQVEQFIIGWNGVPVSYGPNEVIFDISIFAAIQSKGYWDIDVSGVVWTEIDYDQATGVHTVQADYSALGNNPSYVETFVEGQAQGIVSHADRVITFTVTRQMVRDEFQFDIARASSRMIERRRYYVDPAVVDTIAAGGGVYEATVGQLQIYLKDRWVE